MTDGISSRYINNVVEHFSSLPGIGKKTALRFALHLLKQDQEEVEAFGDALKDMFANVKYCKKCHNISETDICDICANPKRNHSLICVVQDVRDVIAIENTQSYFGVYHVLGGIISPMDGIGPNDLKIDSLVEKLSQYQQEKEEAEVVLALPATMEGDTTNFYIYKKIQKLAIKVTTIAKGVSIGDDIQYADQMTLSRSIQNRTLFEQTLSA